MTIITVIVSFPTTACLYMVVPMTAIYYMAKCQQRVRCVVCGTSAVQITASHSYHGSCVSGLGMELSLG